MASLRQRCAERSNAGAKKVHARLLAQYPDDLSANWLGYKIIGDDDSAEQLFVEYDERKDFVTMSTYLGYEHCDPTPYPNFMQSMAGQGIEDRKVIALPYRCDQLMQRLSEKLMARG